MKLNLLAISSLLTNICHKIFEFSISSNFPVDNLWSVFWIRLFIFSVEKRILIYLKYLLGSQSSASLRSATHDCPCELLDIISTQNLIYLVYFMLFKSIITWNLCWNRKNLHSRISCVIILQNLDSQCEDTETHMIIQIKSMISFNAFRFVMCCINFPIRIDNLS